MYLPKVYLSLSNSIYHNLAYEQFLCKIFKPKDRILFIYRNHPSVVIGRNQNPWKECNIPYLKRNGIALSRRYSGGGTVYHDLGNMNFTFIGDAGKDMRKQNLEILVSCLRKTFGLTVFINEYFDICYRRPFSDVVAKISGSAAKLTRTYTLHHCTLLVHTDIESMHNSLSSPYNDKIDSLNATRSRKAKSVIRLEDLIPEVTCSLLSHVISMEFYSKCFNPPEICEEKINPEIESCNLDHLQELTSWNFIYGKTPKFRYQIDEDNAIFVQNGCVMRDVADSCHSSAQQFDDFLKSLRSD